MTPSQHRIINAFYIEAGCRDLIPIYPLYAVMFTAHGLSPMEVSVLFALWALTVIVAEVPSGTLADLYSKKLLVILGAVLKATGFIVWLAWPGFFGFLLGFILWGLSSALRSGAWESLLYLSLTHWGESPRFTRIYSNAMTLAGLTNGAAQLLGAWLIIYGFDEVLLVSALICLLGVIPFILWAKDVPSSPGDTAETEETNTFMGMLRTGLGEATQNVFVRFLLVFQAGLIVFHDSYDEFVPLLLQEKGFTYQHLALVISLIFLSSALGRFAAGYLSSRRVSPMLFSLVLAGLILFGSTAAHTVMTIVLLCLFFFLFAFNATWLSATLQHQIRSEARATVTSIVKMLEEINAIPLFLVFGWIAHHWQIAGATQVFAALIFILSIALMGLARRWNI